MYSRSRGDCGINEYSGDCINISLAVECDPVTIQRAPMILVDSEIRARHPYASSSWQRLVSLTMKLWPKLSYCRSFHQRYPFDQYFRKCSGNWHDVLCASESERVCVVMPGIHAASDVGH